MAKRAKLRICEVCGQSNEDGYPVWNSRKYRMTLCNRHLCQMRARGEILERTCYEPNQVIERDGYIEIVLCNRAGEEVARALASQDKRALLSGYRWHLSRQGYAKTNLAGRTVPMGGIIMGIITNRSIVVDHLNRKRLDSRNENLRVISFAENTRNRKRPSNNTSGATGVSWHKGKRAWTSQITRNGKRHWLGTFDKLGAAAQARKIAEETL